MVDPVCFSTDSRRYSSRVGPLLPASSTSSSAYAPDRHHARYPLSSLVDARPPSRIMSEREPEIDQQPRKRIAVACGRCRKRKIRCSGDPGNGEPCSNCRNANAESCQFLRVASTEAPILHERGSFAYDVETARSHHVHARQAAAAAAAAAAAPFSPQFAQEIPDGLSRYPTPSSSHPYTRYYQTTTPWAAYPDDVDYTAMSTYSPSCYAVAAAAHESPYASFRMAPSARSALYGDASAAYPAVQHHHHHHQQHRPPVPVSVEPQSSSMSLSSVAAALPPTMDRMLPALSAKGLAPGYHHHLDPIPVPVPVSAYAHAKSASSSPDASPTDSVHYAPAYDASPVSSFTQATSLAGSSSHRESASTGCGSDSYASSTGTGSGSLYADAEPLSRSSLPDYALRGSASRRESDSYSLAGPQGYTMHAGPIPSPSIAGRGLHQAQAQAAAAAAAAAASSAYMISGSSAAANASSDPSTSPHHDQGENDAGLVAHHDMHRTRAAPSLSAA